MTQAAGARTSWLALAAIAIVAALALYCSGSPHPAPASAPPARFSAARALLDVRNIAGTTHAIGSREHDRVRDWVVARLREVGVDTIEIQRATGFNTTSGPIAAPVDNVVALRRGTRPSGKALVLMAHYDAVPGSLGAGDDGAGVAVILETLRALKNAPPIANDLLVIITDAEEPGLLGAEAFVHLHPWARNAAVVLNFEGRGTSGPVLMFQTSPGNGALIGALAASVSTSRSNSLMGDVYRQLHNDTDLSIWLDAAPAVGAMNFAHIGGFTRYHTPLDNVDQLDARTVQHMGDYALGLARQFGGMDLTLPARPDAVYFDVPLLGVVHYPAALALPLGLLAALLAGAVIVVLSLRGLVTVRGALRGTIALIAALLIPALTTWAAWRAVMLLHPGFADILHREPYNATWYFVAGAIGSVWMVFSVYRHALRNATAIELMVAPLIASSIAAIALALLLPGGSYLVTWPLLGSTAIAWRLQQPRSAGQVVALVLLSIPLLIVWIPLIRSLEVALTMQAISSLAMLAAFVAVQLMPAVAPDGAAWRGMRLIGLGAIMAALVIAEIKAPFSEARPRPDSLFYLSDLDLGQAWWVTWDRSADTWTRPALGASPRPMSLATYHLGQASQQYLATPASPAEIFLPQVLLVASDSAPGGRHVRLHVGGIATSRSWSLYVDDPRIMVSDMVIDGRPLPSGTRGAYSDDYRMGRDGLVLKYVGTRTEGADIEFTIHADDAAPFRFVAVTPGLPAMNGNSFPVRPAGLMSKPFVVTDAVITTRHLRL